MSARTFFQTMLVVVVCINLWSISQLVSLGASYQLQGHGLHPLAVGVALVFEVFITICAINLFARSISFGE